MTSNTIPYLFENQGASYQSLADTDFRLAVVDKDDANLTSSQISSLQDAGKTVLSYVSIGEAESYRDYWANGNWSSNTPSFVLGENPNWAGNYEVKFWDSAWQQTIIDRVDSVAKAGYNGVYMDIVDAYTSTNLVSAYGGDSAGLREEMMKFVEKISSSAKAINPDFKIIQNNALDLVAANPDSPTAPNTAYLKAIDGVGAESTWTDGNTKVAWTDWNLKFLDLAAASGKTVLTIDYPTDSTLQQEYIATAASHGFIPFVGNLALDSNIPSINGTIMDQLKSGVMDNATGSSTVHVNTDTDSSTDNSADTDTGSSDNSSSDSGSTGNGSSNPVENEDNGHTGSTSSSGSSNSHQGSAGSNSSSNGGSNSASNDDSSNNAGTSSGGTGGNSAGNAGSNHDNGSHAAHSDVSEAFINRFHFSSDNASDNGSSDEYRSRFHFSSDNASHTDSSSDYQGQSHDHNFGLAGEHSAMFHAHDA